MAARRRTRVKDLSQPEYETLAGFRYALRGFLSFSETAARGIGLTPQQYQAMLVVKGAPAGGGPTVGGLAERLGLKHHSAVGLVDRLCAQGLAARRVSRGDRRQVRVVLTARGGRLLARLARQHRDELRRRAPMLMELLGRLSRKPPP